MEYQCSDSVPQIGIHFDKIGFDLSILVTRWFIPLFSNNLRFSFLFRFWDYLFCVGISGLFRLSVAILVLYQNDILNRDIIQVSDFIHSVGTAKLRREKDIQSLFDVMLTLTGVEMI